MGSMVLTHRYEIGQGQVQSGTAHRPYERQGETLQLWQARPVGTGSETEAGADHQDFNQSRFQSNRHGKAGVPPGGNTGNKSAVIKSINPVKWTYCSPSRGNMRSPPQHQKRQGGIL